MFSFSANLGLVFSHDLSGVLSAFIALISIFLPGFLLVAGILPFWGKVSKGIYSTRAIAGVNAAVVGILGAALYNPIFVTAIKGPVDLSIGIVAFMFLAALRISPLFVVAWCVLASIFMALIGL
jgi:chromate transporter